MSGILFLVGNVASVLVGGYAFVEAEDRGRVLIASLMGAAFLLPRLFPSLTLRLVCFVARMILAIGCVVYLKWKQAL